MREKRKVEKQNIELYTHFSFAYVENLQNVAHALMLSGYFVNARRDGSVYILNVYKRI